MKTDSRRRNLAAALVFSQNKDYNSINDIMKQGRFGYGYIS